MSSELLVAMTAIDSANNEPLVDMNCIESSSNSESLVDVPSNTSEALMNDPTVRFFVNDAVASKSSVSTSIFFKGFFFLNFISLLAKK